MPFVKDTSYRNIPFSPEAPNHDFHCFLTVTKLIDKISKNRDRVFRCRTVGIVSCDFGAHVLHEIDDNKVQVRLSLAYVRRIPPFTGKPYPAQLFGFGHWKNGVGPLIFPQILQSVPVFMAVRLRETMSWVVATHNAAEGKEEATLLHCVTE